MFTTIILHHLSGLIHGPDGNFYQYNTEPVQWTEAKKRCQNKGGRLAILNSNLASSFIEDKFPADTFWIGGQQKEKRWYWVNGMEMSFKNRAWGQPDAGPGSFCAVKWKNGPWHDIRCSISVPYLCQFKIKKQCSILK